MIIVNGATFPKLPATVSKSIPSCSEISFKSIFSFSEANPLGWLYLKLNQDPSSYIRLRSVCGNKEKCLVTTLYCVVSSFLSISFVHTAQFLSHSLRHNLYGTNAKKVEM